MPDDALSKHIDTFLTGWFRMRQTVMEANFHRAHRQGLSTTQFLVLNLLAGETAEERRDERVGHGERRARSEQSHPWTLRRLATALNLEPTTLVHTIDSLEQRGVVARQRDTTDRRRVHITLTPAGYSMQVESRDTFRARLAEIFQAMTPDDRQALLTGFAAFATAAQAASSLDERDTPSPSHEQGNTHEQ